MRNIKVAALFLLLAACDSKIDAQQKQTHEWLKNADNFPSWECPDQNSLKLVLSNGGKDQAGRAPVCIHYDFPVRRP